MTKEELKKEAEKYVIKKHHIDKTKLPIDFSLSCEFSDDFTDFQNGAEFGYNKANERHIKAKNLLTRFIMGSVYFNDKETDLVEEAEQFLRKLEE